MGRTSTRAAFLSTAARIWAHAARMRSPRPVDVPGRLAMLAAGAAPVARPVRIAWDDHQVPFVEAQSLRDAAVGLGVVHAHLRLAQIEMMRRVATGRLSEVVGPAGVELDVALRTVDFVAAGRAAQGALGAQARAWMAGFLDGLNHQIAHQAEVPHEFRLLGLAPEPWSLDDLMAVSRLASIDFSWRVWLQLLRLRGGRDWPAAWARLLGPAGAAEGAPPPEEDALVEALEAFGRPGSNAYALAGSRTRSGRPLLGGDPHLSIQMPNLWLIAGVHAPDLHAVGLMVPAVPAFGLGRNRHIAWGGTSLHASSSELVSLAGIDASIVPRRERIGLRGGSVREVEVRDSAFGPVVSDVPMLGLDPDEPVALHWMGHRPSDEVSAMLGIAQAHDWRGFRAAASGYAVPGLNLVYADTAGRIGQAMAATLPRRPPERPADVVSPGEALEHWRATVAGPDLPHRVDPAQGYVASANDAPPRSDVVISHFFSPDDRVVRLREVLGGAAGAGADDLARLQQDVASAPAAALRDRLLAVAGEGALASAVGQALAGWDGAYTPGSAGALAFELVVGHLVRHLHPDPGEALYLASWDALGLLRRDVDAAAPRALRAAVDRSIAEARRPFRRLKVWGAAHRLRLAHPLARLPGVGRRYRVGEWPVGGSNETLMKTRHGLARGRHTVGFGAQARHVSDLADPDDNRFVLLGGQDGWLGSTTFADQVPLWRAGRHLRVPLRVETVRRTFPHVTTLMPRRGGC